MNSLVRNITCDNDILHLAKSGDYRFLIDFMSSDETKDLLKSFALEYGGKYLEKTIELKNILKNVLINEKYSLLVKEGALYGLEDFAYVKEYRYELKDFFNNLLETSKDAIIKNFSEEIVEDIEDGLYE